MNANKKVLVVEDSATLREQLVAMLAQDYRVLQAQDGVEALEIAQREQPDAIVTDLEMPRMDGVELLKALRAAEKTTDTPVLIVTTTTSVIRMNECRSLRCSGYVLKPINREYLQAKLRMLMPA